MVDIIQVAKNKLENVSKKQKLTDKEVDFYLKAYKFSCEKSALVF